MYWPLMRKILRDLAVGWKIMTENEFDAFMVLYDSDGDLIREMARKINSSDDLPDAVYEAWRPFAMAIVQQDHLFGRSVEEKDPETKKELLRRAHSIDISAFFPDAALYPEMGGTLPGLIVSDDGTGAKPED